MGMQKYRRGFTIIEVMLFLAVSGALAIGILATSTIGINNQRYVDAVNSFKALVQEEFTNTTQVINSRQDGSACPNLSNTKPVGASECVVMGRLLTINPDGGIVRSNIIGIAPADESSLTGDIQAIIAYSPTLDTTDQAMGTMNWGTYLKDKKPVSIVIFRSPLSGNVLAFVDDTDSSVISSEDQLHDFVNDPDKFKNTDPKTICIDPSGWTIAQTQAVIITAGAAGPSGVEQKAGVEVCA